MRPARRDQGRRRGKGMQGVGGADIEQAIALFKAGNAAAAAQACRAALRRDGRNVTARFLLALTQMQLRDFEEAERQFAKATALDPAAAEIWANRGNNQIALGRPDSALEFLTRALALEPNFPEASYNQARLLADAGRAEEALAAYDKCLALVPRFADALNNRGVILAKLGRHDEALASYEKCLAIAPNAADTLNNRGTLLASLGRREEALASYDASLAIAPDSVDTLTNRANMLASLRRNEEALASLDRAVRLAPDRPELLDRRGNFLAALGRDEDAFASFDACVSVAPGFAAAWLSVIKLLVARQRFEEAQRVVGKLLAVAPDSDFAQGYLAFAKLSLCDWNGLAEIISALRDQVTREKSVTLPFHTLLTLTSPRDQLKCAKARAALEFPPAAVAKIAPGRYDHDRIRLAYISADFRDHPVSQLLAGLIERHDRTRFETIAIAFGPDDGSAMRTRLKGAFERFIDVDAAGDFETAKLLRALEVDIAIDLMGFTQGCRPGILAPHPAPLQVGFLGYAGTTGAAFIDYIIADRVIVPEESCAFYSEKVVHLPDCYLPNGPRKVAEKTPTRDEVGLPEHGFVFCCFNQHVKLTPDVFDVWMRLLSRIEGSVLWLPAANAAASANLRSEAGRRGVNPARLVFAPRVPANEDHLARQSLADLFLDTSPYNAHSSAGDALWAGLPVLTCMGATLAARVAASQLHAIGLPELVTTSLDEYEALAFRLASEPERLGALKAKLVVHRRTHALFDTARFCRGIEAAYVTMLERHRRGEPPQGFAVAAPDRPVP
jgi:protein O-GlcNAc transferase